MLVKTRDNLLKGCPDVSRSSQVWGVVDFSRQDGDMKTSLTAALRGRPNAEWVAGNNCCLACEREQDSDDMSLHSCAKSALHIAVIGKAWPLDHGKEEDAQLVGNLYRSYDKGFINQSDGQFAAAIVDERNHRAVLSVNWPGGIHPLYYCVRDRSLYFATRIDFLIRHGVRQPKVNEQAVVDLLRFGGLVSETTLLEDVYRVIPGYAVVFKEGCAVQYPVYEFPPREDLDPSDATEMVRLHREAMEKRISGRDDFGLFLSGGLDSSMNVAAATELSSRPIKTFTVAYEDRRFDESNFANLVVSKHKTDHCELRLDTADCLDRLPEMVWAMQDPISDYSYVPTFYITEAIKQHVALAIGGDGPDHLLGRGYAHALWYDLLHRIPLARRLAAWSVKVTENDGTLRSHLWRHARRKRFARQLWQSLACGADPCVSGAINSFSTVIWGDTAPNDVMRLLSPDLLRRTRVTPCHQDWMKRWQQHRNGNTLTNFTLVDTTLSGLCGVFAKVGTMCSAHNLMIREPYLATPVVRYFLQVKNSWKVDGSWKQRFLRRVPSSQTKRILRQAAEGYVPSEIRLEKQKHGFELPLVQCWLQSTSGLDTQQIFGALFNHTDWLNPTYLDTLVREQASGARNYRYLLLLLAALDQWFRIFIEGDAQSPTWRWSDSF
ncbi:MAG: asparagine synthetase B family protein [Planctomycetota bacterium]|jgi:asparagine synthase (glutamine-hydrolysing)